MKCESGYDDSSLLFLLLPPNQDGPIPTIQENQIDNDSLPWRIGIGAPLSTPLSTHSPTHSNKQYSLSTHDRRRIMMENGISAS